MASRKKRASTPKIKAAAAKATAASHAAHPKGHLTPKQLAADRANLVDARAALAQSGANSKKSAKRLLAERANMAKARAVEAKKPRSAKQLAEIQKWLAKGRAAYIAKYGHPWHSYVWTNYSGYSSSSSGKTSFLKGGYFGGSSFLRPRGPGGAMKIATHPEVLGSRRISPSYTYHLTVKKPTGTNRKFKKRIAPTSFDTRTSWKSSHASHMKKRLRPRKHKTAHVAHWRHRTKRLTPT